MSLEFESDGVKAASSESKHGVTFEEAATIFPDPVAANSPMMSSTWRRINGRSLLVIRPTIDFCWSVSPNARGPFIICARRATRKIATIMARRDSSEYEVNGDALKLAFDWGRPKDVSAERGRVPMFFE